MSEELKEAVMLFGAFVVIILVVGVSRMIPAFL